jgi:hypothetical protein
MPINQGPCAGDKNSKLTPIELRRALILKGELIPQTEEEVRLFEEAVSIDNVDLPDSLKDPFAILSRAKLKSDK